MCSLAKRSSCPRRKPLALCGPFIVHSYFQQLGTSD